MRSSLFIPALPTLTALIAMIGLEGDITLTLNEETLAGGMNGILPEEEPLHDAMRTALEGSTRPEWDAEEAAEDLRILAKQGVSLAEMGEGDGLGYLCATDTRHEKRAEELVPLHSALDWHDGQPAALTEACCDCRNVYATRK